MLASRNCCCTRRIVGRQMKLTLLIVSTRSENLYKPNGTPSLCQILACFLHETPIIHQHHLILPLTTNSPLPTSTLHPSPSNALLIAGPNFARPPSLCLPTPVTILNPPPTSLPPPATLFSHSCDFSRTFRYDRRVIWQLGVKL